MTMVRPCRLITRQRSHIGFTDGLTFISAIPVRDPAAREVVRRQLGLHLVAREDPDVVLPHLSRDCRENVVSPSTCTRNIVLGRASVISPSTSILSSCLAKSLSVRLHEKRARTFRPVRTRHG